MTDSPADPPTSPNDDLAASDAAVSDAEVAAAKRSLVRDVGIYTIFRLLLVAVIAAVLYGIGRLFIDDVPVIAVLLFAIVIALPLSMLLGTRLRRRVAANAAIIDDRRKQRRADFRRRLQGVDE